MQLRTLHRSANVMVIVFVYVSILQTLLFRTLHTNAAVTISGLANAAVTSIVLSDAADECGNAAIANIRLRSVRWSVA